MKRMLGLLFVVLLLTGCEQEAQENASEESVPPDNNVAISAESPPIESEDAVEEADTHEPDPIEILEIDTGCKTINSYYWNMAQRYTIIFQKELVGHDFILSEWDFDVFQQNDKYWLKAVFWDEVYFIELSEMQLETLLEYPQYTEFAFLFNMADVKPIEVTFSPELEYSYDEYDRVDDDSINAYIYMNECYKVVFGVCLDIYVLDDANNMYLKVS